MTTDTFDAVMRVRCPGWLLRLVDTAAKQGGDTASRYIREAVSSRLVADGIDLCWEDRLQPEEQWARVEGTVISTIFPHGVRPEGEGTFLPIVSVDEQPFDSTKHYRLKPRYELRSGYVARVYPIIRKEDDGAELIAREAV